MLTAEIGPVLSSVVSTERTEGDIPQTLCQTERDTGPFQAWPLKSL